MTDAPVTKEEFEARYAQRSKVTLAWLHSMGRRARPCRCDFYGCEGWQMISDESWDAFAQMQAGVITVEEFNKQTDGHDGH